MRSPSLLRETRSPDRVSWDRSRRLRLDSSLAAAMAAAIYKWLFVRWIRWLNGRERNRLINERQEERGRIDATTTMLNKLLGEAKKGTAGRRERERPNEGETDATDRPTEPRETFSDANEERMVEKADERGGRERGRERGREGREEQQKRNR